MMGLFKSSLCVLGVSVVLLLSAVSCLESATPLSPRSDVGNWTVGSCILASFSMTFQVYLNGTSEDKGERISLPVNASVLQGNNPENCQNETQTLILNWSDMSKNGTSLERNLTVHFHLNQTYYGISRLYADFRMGYWNESRTIIDDKNVTRNVTVHRYSTINIDSGDLTKNVLLKTPIHKSYLCADIGTVSFETQIYYDGKGPFNNLKNSTIHGQQVRFDAFRGPDASPNVMQTPMDCDYRPNDVIPIAVGCALAALVVCILLAYLFGRRRSRQSGYQSV